MERLELEGNSTLSDDDIIPQVAEGMGAGDNWKPVIVDFAGEQLSFAIIQRWPASLRGLFCIYTNCLFETWPL